MNFYIFLLIFILGTGSSAFICSKSNLPVKIRYRLDINSRNKVMIIDILDLLLLCFAYSLSRDVENTMIKVLGIILIFILVFIYYLLSDIKGMIIKEEAEEKERNKYKYENEFCYFCGYKLENGEKTCPNCGKNIGDGS
ncbi:MAG: hypothetical protein WCQ54_09140 [Clostridiaceae bacterium]